MKLLRSTAIIAAVSLLITAAMPLTLAQTDSAPTDGSAEVMVDPAQTTDNASVQKKSGKKVVKKTVKKKKAKKVVKKKVKKAKKAKKVKKQADEGVVESPMLVQYTVHIKDFQFQPPTLTIKKGETVEFIQDDEIGHTVSTDPHPDHTQLPGFVSAVLAKGQKFTHTFNDVGTWTYHCSPHPSMKGTIVVTE